MDRACADGAATGRVEGGAPPAGLALGPRMLRFAAVGASGVPVNLGALWLLAGVLGVRDVLASAAAVEVSIVWNFCLNNAFTYRDRNALARAGFWERLGRYNLVSLVGLAIQLGTFLLARAALLRGLGRESLGDLRYLAQLGGIVLATAWSFVGNFHFTWRQAARSGAAA
jgi:putative flippase GtrA